MNNTYNNMDKFYVNNITETPIELEINLNNSNYDYYMTALHERVIVAFKTNPVEEENRYDKITIFNIITTKYEPNPITLLKEEWEYPALPTMAISEDDWNSYILSSYNIERPKTTNICDNDYFEKDYVNKQDNVFFFFDLTNEEKVLLLNKGLTNFNISIQKTKEENNDCTKEPIKTENITIVKPHINNVDILAIAPYIESQYYIGGMTANPIKLDVKPCSQNKVHFNAVSRSEFTIVGKFYQIEEKKYRVLDAIHIKKNPTEENPNKIDYKYELGIGDSLPGNSVFKQWNEVITHTHSTDYAAILEDVDEQCKKTALKYYTEPKIDNLYTSKWKESTNTLNNTDLEQEVNIFINNVEHKHKLIDLLTGKVEIEGYDKDYFDVDTKYIKLVPGATEENKCNIGEGANITSKKVRIYKLYRKEDLVENAEVIEKKRLPENITVQGINIVDTGVEQYRIVARSESELNYRLRQYS